MKHVAKFKEFAAINEKHFTPGEKAVWKRGMDKDFETVVQKMDHSYNQALSYCKHMLKQLTDKYGKYNSAQAQIIVDRATRKFDLSPTQVKNINVDIFDHENRDSEMNDGIEDFD